MTAAVWRSGGALPGFTSSDIQTAVPRFRESVHVVREGEVGRIGLALGGDIIAQEQVNGVPTYPLLATLPPLYPEWLGDRSFCETHNLRFPYVSGAMANGIATTDIVVEMAKAGMMGFFGAAGLGVKRVEAAIDDIETRLHGTNASWGSNLIHSPNEPELEAGVVELYLRRGVRRVSAAAYMALTPMVVRFAYHGLKLDDSGQVVRPNYVFAKISRPEVARRFLAPAPADMLLDLVQRGWLTAEEARIGATLPVAEDIIVESDSGGHTDNQALTALFPTITAVRDELTRAHNYTRAIRIGAAGGLGTPQAVAAAFALGAAFVLTGSVNQGAIESGLDDYGKKLLANAGLADVIMAPAADMFELGVKVQVLQRGTMFGVRALKLYELYNAYDSLYDIPADERSKLEKTILGKTVDEVWEGCRSFFAERDPRELAKAEADPKHQMALVFRWYLGLSSKWAIWGEADRKMDYQIWCGPAMGSFNSWAKGTFLERPENRTVVQIARNLLEGAAVVTRAQQLRSYGVAVPAATFDFRPRPLR
jgi:trans-AT polyketide synthase, acyltransferase and oxidoreductase domains